jgi:hypothetical protein
MGGFGSGSIKTPDPWTSGWGKELFPQCA